MNPIQRIAWGNVDAFKEVYDWADKDVLTKIKKNFGEIQRPSLWDGLPNARILINEENMPV